MTLGILGAVLIACAPLVAEAALVRGTVRFPDEVKGGTLRQGAFWRVPNGVLPIAPPLFDVRAEAVVVLVPSGTPGAAQLEAEARRQAQRHELRLVGLRFHPPVSVIPPGTPLALRNEDKVPHVLLCTSCADKIPPQTLAPGAHATLTLVRPGEYLLHSQEYAHMTGAVLVIERGFFARVEPEGNFQMDVPEGRYQARLFWRGSWQAEQLLQVGEQGAELHLRATLPSPLSGGDPGAPWRRPSS
ncbi:MAG: hypothetical protein RMK29_07600 [Myxococcales bacterium]|nr:hypothetical protein [Myxococcota bacterium]MDW8281559.1 hypothetical protein [Myxococcales bacterium]